MFLPCRSRIIRSYVAAALVCISTFIDVASAAITTSGNVTPTYPDTQNDPWQTYDVDVGRTGAASLRIDQGSVVQTGGNGLVGGYAGSNGTASIDGAGSLWNITSVLTVGREGNGTLMVSSGGTVAVSLYTYIGGYSTSDGLVTVNGEGSKLITNYTSVGIYGTANLVVENGGTVEATSAINIDVLGSVRVNGQNTSLNSPTVRVGNSFGDQPPNNAILLAEDSARINIGRSLFIYDDARVQLIPEQHGRITVGPSSGTTATDSTSHIDVMPNASSFGVNLRSGEIEVGELKLHASPNWPNHDPSVIARFNGNGRVTGKVHNQGSVVVNGNYGKFFNVAPYAEAQLFVKGDYIQSAEGTLTLSISEDNRDHLLDNESSNLQLTYGKFPLFVEASAKLGGSLQIDRTGLLEDPQIGDSFNLIRYRDVEGRFERVTGTKINDSRFFGLRYGADRLQAVVLETPRRSDATRLTTNDAPNSSASNLVLVTHGWSSEAGYINNPDLNQWKPRIARDEALRAGEDWDGAVMDWSELAATTYPWQAASRAIDVGESLGFWMEEVGLSYTKAHIIGHSAGIWLADSLVAELERSRPVLASHLTLIDGYTPNSVIKRGGTATKEQIGASADWADHFVDARNAAGHLAIQNTNETLPNVFTLDVTQLDPLIDYVEFYETYEPIHNAISLINAARSRDTDWSIWHRWPGEFYAMALAPIPNPDPSPENFSPAEYLARIGASTGFWGTRGILPQMRKDVRAIFDSFGHVGFYKQGELVAAIIDEENSILSETGTVEFGEEGAFTMTTGSPVFISSSLEIASPVNLLDFSFDFVIGEDSL